jgi:hypothetical protein
MDWKRAIVVGVITAITVIGLTVAIRGFRVGQPSPTFNREIDGSASLNVWSCLKYSIDFPANANVAKVQVSRTAAPGNGVVPALPQIYLKSSCEDIGFAHGPVPVDAATGRATFYLWSDVLNPGDTAGYTKVWADAQGSGPVGGGMSFSATKIITVVWPDVVPACNWVQGWTTCKGHCTNAQSLGGILYTRIPYTAEWKTQGCCPNPPGNYYQLYSAGNGTCKKQ